MKKIYSIVLMAAALLVGTNAWAATTRTAANAEQFEAAWKAAQDGDVIQLTNDVALTKILWLGTAAMNDEAKSLTLDLNGKLLSNAATKYMFVITHGELNVISSVAGGRIEHSGTDPYSKTSQETFRVAGSTNTDVNPRTAAKCFSHLTIGKGVTVNAKVQNALVVDVLDNTTMYYKNSQNKWKSGWAGYNESNSLVTAGQAIATAKPYSVMGGTSKNSTSYGSANGVRVDVYGRVEAIKYAFKVNGNVDAPAAIADTAYSPYVYIHDGADLYTQPTSAAVEDKGKYEVAAVAAYSSGYARWLIEGTCEGSSGLVAKSGNVQINDATIKSNYSGDYKVPAESGSGVVGAGSAILIQTSAAYAGFIEVSIGGDTKVEAENGYAIEESITQAQSDQTKVELIKITGGSFDGGKVGTDTETGNPIYGTMTVSQTTVDAANNPLESTTITIVGGQATSTKTTGEAQTINQMGNQPLADYLASQTNATHVTYVENEDGSKTMVISEGQAPVGDANIAKNHDKNSSVKWTGDSENITADLELKELEINEDKAQVVTVKDGNVLTVGRVVLGTKAQIIVEAGATFIVSGEQGIIAPKESNIVLKNEDGKRSIFLFNPAVSSNKHPNAKVEFITNSWWVDADHLQWEMFGTPTWNAVKSITCEETTDGVVYASVMVYENSKWVDLGYIGGTYTIDVSKLDKPFTAYDLIAYRAQNKKAPKVIMTGELVGNVNATLNSYMKWTPFANSYTGEVDVYALLNSIINSANTVDKYMYIAEQGGNGSLTWNSFGLEEAEEDAVKLSPMQAFLLNNKGTWAVENEINYKSMIWDPATTSAPAPRRMAANNSAKLRVIVANEEGAWDNVKLRETENVGACEKYMNADVNIYAMDEEKSAILAAEDIENTYLGFSTVKGGNFTISFAKVDGRQFDLVDLETGARVAASEGETYSFNAAANTTNDYRFKLVARNNAPTAIENTEAVKSVKGIYTITGQYVGEMNVWNTLPAGVYVVDGAKRVK